MMTIKPILPLLILLVGVRSKLSAQQTEKISIKVESHTGNYSVTSLVTGWTFAGSIGRSLRNFKSVNGKDEIGEYKSFSFKWKSDNDYSGSIRWYNDLPVVIFSVTLPKGAKNQSLEPFPDFTIVPSSLYHFSYHDVDFSTPEFILNETSTPWLPRAGPTSNMPTPPRS